MRKNDPSPVFPPARSPAVGRVERAAVPGLLLVEAETQAEAEEVFRLLSASRAASGLEVTELSRGLCFVRAKASGRYWRFAPFNTPESSQSVGTAPPAVLPLSLNTTIVRKE